MSAAPHLSVEAEVFVSDRFICSIEALEKASKTNDMTHEWNEFQPKFKQHIESRKECEQLDDKNEAYLYVYNYPQLLFYVHVFVILKFISDAK